MDDGFFYTTQRLDCGHIEAASEESGGFDELNRRPTAGEVADVLRFKIKIHDCEIWERRHGGGSDW